VKVKRDIEVSPKITKEELDMKFKFTFNVVDPRGNVLHTFNRRSDAELCCYNYNHSFNTNKFKIRRRIAR
jgi:hypothetical protein